MALSAKGTALITGASSGIGAIYAERLSRRGYNLILVARRRDKLNALASKIGTATGRAVEVVTADLGKRDDLRRIEGGMLAQSWDRLEADPAAGEVKTKRAPTAEELRDLGFAWKICSMVKSNAIVVVKDGQLLGVGAGQMSRLDSVRIAVEKAGAKARGSVLASDAFFPFRDGPDAAAAGVAAIIQPGGSKRDDETVAACDEHGMAMIFTGRRHFRH